MAKKGKLSNTDKMAIQKGVSKGLTVDSIANSLDRTTKIVDNYISGELNDLLSTIAGAQIDKDEAQTPASYDESDLSKKYDHIDPRTIIHVTNKLITAGLTENDTRQLIISALDSSNGDPSMNNDELLYTRCISRMSAGHFITKKTQGGREGVAIMSEAASIRGDMHAKKSLGNSRSSRGNVFNPKTGEYM